MNLIIGSDDIQIKDIYNCAFNNGSISLSDDKKFLNRIKESRRIFEKKIELNEPIYGVTTGYGDSCTKLIPKKIQRALPIRLTRYHQCGLGDVFTLNETRAIQITRIISLTRGYSAVRLELIEFMIDLFNKGISPRIVKEGSVGASGDLTPLAYYAATLIGEGEVQYKNEFQSTIDLYKKLDIKPIELHEKEGLALMNGTAVMSAISCIAFEQSYYMADICSKITAMNTISLKSNKEHFNPALFKAKPHTGSIKVAKDIASHLINIDPIDDSSRLQERYSIRCAPHVIGVLLDGLDNLKNIVVTEINSANDNPLIDIETETVLHGGNFYGGHIAFVMDSLKVLVSNIADLMDRQIALMVDTKFSNGLPSDLSYDTNEDAILNHGLKALQISSSAWCAEALKNTMPASVFSRSTESHNQDKVSMGTISARDCLRNIELTNQVISAALIVSAQALDIRIDKKEIDQNKISKELMSFYSGIRSIVKRIKEDRPLEMDLRNLLNKLMNIKEVKI